MDDRLARRLRWLVPPGLLATLALGWMVGPASAYRPQVQRPSPVFAEDDGLPAELVSGEYYTARFTVTIPPDWPVRQISDAGSTAALTVTARGRGEDAPPDAPEMEGVIYCTGDYPNAAGTTVTLSCSLHIHDPGPLSLHLYAATGGLFIPQLAPDGDPLVDDIEHVYRHTVVPRPQEGVPTSMPRHISSLVPSPHTT